MTSEGSKSRIKWEGDSNKVIRSWPPDVRGTLGVDLHRLDNNEEPLNSKSMGKSMPGIRELRDQDDSFWYRLLYAFHRGWIHVLHCFTKKTNQTSESDKKIAMDRLDAVKRRQDEPYEPPVKEEEKSA